MGRQIVAVPFTGGERREVYEDDDGRQYILDGAKSKWQ